MVHEEQLSVADAAAALPDRQVTALAVAVERIAKRNVVDADCMPGAADTLSRQAEHPLQKRHAASDVAALHDERGDGLGRHHDDKVGHLETTNGIDGVEADGLARGRVPDELHRQGRGAGEGDAKNAEGGQRKVIEPRHRTISRRRSHA